MQSGLPLDREYRRFKLGTQIAAKLQAHVRKRCLGNNDLFFELPVEDRPRVRAPRLDADPEALGRTEPNAAGHRYRHGTLTGYSLGRCRCETRMTTSTPPCSQIRCGPTGTLEALRPDIEATRALQAPVSVPPRPGPGVSWRDRPVHQPWQRDQSGVLAPLPGCGQGAMAVPGPPRRAAAVSWLYRRRLRHCAAHLADGRGAGTGLAPKARPAVRSPWRSQALTAALNGQISVLDAEIVRLFAAHPEQHIFASLPAPGSSAPRPLPAEISDCLPRFPTDDALAALAGGVPVASAIRQAKPGRVPLVVQQETPRRRHGLC